MTNTRTIAIFIEIISALLILLFVYTGTSKLLDHDAFQHTLAKAPLIEKFSGVLSWALPIGEIGISLLLFIPRLRQTGLLLSFLLMTVFTFYISYMLLFSPDRPCSCGGVLKNLGWEEHLLFNIYFTLLAFAGWQLQKRMKRFIAINRESRIPV